MKLFFTPNSLKNTCLAEADLYCSMLKAVFRIWKYVLDCVKRYGMTRSLALSFCWVCGTLVPFSPLFCYSKLQQYMKLPTGWKCPWISQNMSIIRSSWMILARFLIAYIIGVRNGEGVVHCLLRSKPFKFVRWLPWITPSMLSIGTTYMMYFDRSALATGLSSRR